MSTQPDADLNPSPQVPLGMLAEFETAAEIKHAAKCVRDAGYEHWDVFTPFPIHGLEAAMGLRSSRVGWFAFVGGVIGFCSGMLMSVCRPGRRGRSIHDHRVHRRAKPGIAGCHHCR
jgi:hypothetical protein